MVDTAATADMGMDMGMDTLMGILRMAALQVKACNISKTVPAFPPIPIKQREWDGVWFPV